MKKNERQYARNALKRNQIKQHRSVGNRSSFVPDTETDKGLKKAMVILPILIIAVLITVLAVGINRFTGILDSSRKGSFGASEISRQAQPDNAKLLLVISPGSPLPSDYKTDLTDYENVRVDSCITADLDELTEAAAEQGLELGLTQGYVSAEEQYKAYEAELSRLQTEESMTRTNAAEQAEKTVPAENHSEFQSGLAVRFSDDTEGFGETREFFWLKANCAKYGFILRYPEGKEKVTGFGYDPTHFRYVGKENAMQMTTLNMTLEEYSEYLAARS